MKIDVTQGILDLYGKPLFKPAEEEGGEKRAWTLRDVVIDALLASDKGDQDGAQKLKVYKLAMKVGSEDVVELSAEDVVLIKTRIGKYFVPLVVGRTWEMLDP